MAGEDEDYGFYDEDEENYCYGEEEEEEEDSCPDDCFDEVDVDSYIREKEVFKIMNLKEIKARQQEDITFISSMLAVSPSSSITLLLHQKWSTDTVCEAFFADEEKIRTTFGLPPATGMAHGEVSSSCGICWDEHDPPAISSTPACSHFYCHTCWLGYISTAIADGPGCLLLRCPDPSCTASIGADLVHTIVSDKENEKYQHFLVKSYVENSNNCIKWCPAAGCDLAVQHTDSDRSSIVKCNCSHSFCWNCLEEPHRPVDCDTVKAWLIKNSSEAENTTWILAHSKPCPSCKKSIEKNDGCMHMTCQCKHQFCWLCRGNWKDHGQETGGYYACNRYNEHTHSKEETMREMAKEAIERYTHYFERWIANHKSAAIAKKELEELRDWKLHERVELSAQANAGEVDVVLKAWQQVVECRLVLKWTYAYGYYLPSGKSMEKKKNFFEYLQGEAESALEKLHICAEQEMGEFLDRTSQWDYTEFREIRAKLVGLTDVTMKYFDKLLTSMEGGLEDVLPSLTLREAEEKMTGTSNDNTWTEPKKKKRANKKSRSKNGGSNR